MHTQTQQSTEWDLAPLVIELETYRLFRRWSALPGSSSSGGLSYCDRRTQVGQVGAALVVGEGGWLLIEMMSASSSNGTGGTETLEPRSLPLCPEAQEQRKGLWDFLTILSEPGISLPRDFLSHGTYRLRSKESFWERLKTRGKEAADSK